MNLPVENSVALSKALSERVNQLDWAHVFEELDAQGSAVLDHVLSPEECRSLVALYTEDALFRGRIVMARHGFGRGEYKYFSYPLPDLIAALRTSIYPHLVSVAAIWASTFVIRKVIKVFWIVVTRRVKPSLPRFCFNMSPAITTASIRIYTASTCFRCRWHSCCLNPAGILKVENSL